jgi:hypothetical protein
MGKHEIFFSWRVIFEGFSKTMERKLDEMHNDEWEISPFSFHKLFCTF